MSNTARITISGQGSFAVFVSVRPTAGKRKPHKESTKKDVQQVKQLKLEI